MGKQYKKIVLEQEIAKVNESFKPRTLAVLNEKAWVQLSLHNGEFPYGMHYHENDDELFICVKGKVDIEMENETVSLCEGELLHIKAGEKHKPIAQEGCYVIRIKTAPHMEAILMDGRVV